MSGSDSYQGYGAGKVFAVLAATFAVIFAGVVVILALDQGQVQQAMDRLQKETTPDMIRLQRLGRNLDQLRNEGERIFSASGQEARQQAVFVITLIASHPSVLDHPRAADVAGEVERFLSATVRAAGDDDRAMRQYYPEWSRLAQRLSLLVDDVLIDGVNLASRDLANVSSVMASTRIQLAAALALVGGFLLLLMLFLRHHLIRPLERIHHSLATLSIDAPAPSFGVSRMAEIQAVQRAIGHLHTLLLRNEMARRDLEGLANHDGLTGLANRRYFMSLAEAELARAARYKRPVTVGLADLDEFKRLNDTHGHAAGDEVLRQFAAMLQDSIRQSDLACRYGGEEFAFVFPETTLEEAQQLTERFRLRFAQHDIVLPDGPVIRMTFSVGLAEAGELPIETALRRADNALYAAKRAGRNRVMTMTALDGASLGDGDASTRLMH